MLYYYCQQRQLGIKGRYHCLGLPRLDILDHSLSDEIIKLTVTLASNNQARGRYRASKGADTLVSVHVGFRDAVILINREPHDYLSRLSFVPMDNAFSRLGAKAIRMSHGAPVDLSRTVKCHRMN